MVCIRKTRRRLLQAFICVANVFFTTLLLYYKKEPLRRWWTHPMLKERDELGAFETVFLKCKQTDHEKFFKLTRMTVEQFDELLDIVRNDIQKKSMRKFLPPEFRLAFTICLLASGNSIVSMSSYWKIGKSTAYAVVKETCEAIWNNLKNTHLAPPSPEDWKKIADGYSARWDLPNCCGALDGKHIRIQCPIGSNSQFYNYKHFFSLVLMALCDSNYCFTWVEIGDYGSNPDSSVFKSSVLGKTMEEGGLNFPPPASLPHTNVSFPFYIVGDEAFPLRTDLLRPFSRRNLRGEEQRIFNYRLSRGRLTIENAFGVLASRWRVLRTSLAHFPHNAESIALATVALHNFIMKREEHLQTFKPYCPPTYVDHLDEDGNLVPGEWRRNHNVRGNFEDVGRVGGNRAAVEAINERNLLASYFLSEEGHVPWQWRSAYRGFEVHMP